MTNDFPPVFARQYDSHLKHLKLKGLHPNKKRLIALLQIVLRVKPRAPLIETKPRPRFLCSCCGAPMVVKRRRILSIAVDRRRSMDLPEEATM